MRTVQIIVKAKGIKTDSSAEGYGQSLAEHIMDTYNDNNSIQACYYKAMPLKSDPLIASAPDLLAALTEAVSRLRYHEPERFDDAEHQKNWENKLTEWDALIAKANGKERT